MTIPVHKLIPGSRWQKTSGSKKVYDIVDIGIDTKTSHAVVFYTRPGLGYTCTRDLGEFLGNYRIENADGTHTYRPLFEPAEDAPKSNG